MLSTRVYPRSFILEIFEFIQLLYSSHAESLATIFAEEWLTITASCKQLIDSYSNFLRALPKRGEDFVGSLGYLTVRLILDSSKSTPYTEGFKGGITGGDSGEMSYGSKLNIPSGVPSETCLSETIEEDVLGVDVFWFVGWGALKFGGGKMGEFRNCGGDDCGEICYCSKKEA